MRRAAARSRETSLILSAVRQGSLKLAGHPASEPSRLWSSPSGKPDLLVRGVPARSFEVRCLPAQIPRVTLVPLRECLRKSTDSLGWFPAFETSRKSSGGLERDSHSDGKIRCG